MTSETGASNVYKKLEQQLDGGFGKKKTLLVALDSPFLDNQYVFPYLGLLYLVSIGRKLGLSTYFTDTDRKLNKELITKHDLFYTDQFDVNNLDQYEGIDLVGISCMTPQGKDAYAIRRKLKERYPNMKIMIGGPHAKHYRGECLSEGFDYVVVGDGERVFETFLTGEIDKLKRFITTFTKDDRFAFADQLTEEEMNDYPPPHREVDYLGKYKYTLGKIPATTIVNSRGCPMGCTFCEDRRTLGRWFSVEHFELELKTIIDQGIRGIMIFDDLFAISPVKIRPYTDILKKYHETEGLVYRCFGHAGTMSRKPEMAKILKESGCVEIGFGAESASQKILDLIEKGTKVRQMHDLVNHCTDVKLPVKAFFMIGLPSESRETFDETYQFLEKYRKEQPNYFDFDCAAFFPYKGTIIGDVARLPEGQSVKHGPRTIDRTHFQIRLREGFTWDMVDDGSMGAYKKKLGESDIVTEIYDWENKKVLLSAEEIQELKDKAMLLSGRYGMVDNKRVLKAEGSIATLNSM